jgi:hypothetical protein
MAWKCKYCSVNSLRISFLLEGLPQTFPIFPHKDQAWHMLPEGWAGPIKATRPFI